jgi:hypothetical protein
LLPGLLRQAHGRRPESSEIDVRHFIHHFLKIQFRQRLVPRQPLKKLPAGLRLLQRLVPRRPLQRLLPGLQRAIAENRRLKQMGAE